jgi:hypothetical protein
MNVCVECNHIDLHDQSGIGVCRVEGCGCDGTPFGWFPEPPACALGDQCGHHPDNPDECIAYPITEYRKAKAEAIHHAICAIGNAMTVPRWDNEFEYSDNVRACLVSDKKGRKAYKKRRNNGCCGSVDIEFDTPWGRAMYGFNYGH